MNDVAKPAPPQPPLTYVLGHKDSSVSPVDQDPSTPPADSTPCYGQDKFGKPVRYKIDLATSEPHWLQTYAVRLMAPPQDGKTPEIVGIRQSGQSCVVEQTAVNNPWLEGDDAVLMVTAIDLLVLPEIKDTRQRKKLAGELEKVIQMGASPQGNFVGSFSLESTKLIHDALEKIKSYFDQQPGGSDETPTSRDLHILALRLLEPLPKDQPLTLLALGAHQGGVLDKSGQILVSLPVKKEGDQIEPDYEKILKVRSEPGSSINRDWKALLAHLEKDGALDPDYPAEPKKKTKADIKFEDESVTLAVSRNVGQGVGDDEIVEGIRTEEITKDVNSALQAIESHPWFGSQYLDQLAQNGVREIVVVDTAFMKQTQQAEAAQLLREAKALFARGQTEMAIAALRTALPKLSYTPNGLYVASEGRIYIRQEILKDPDAFKQVMWHELAHADQAVRLKMGILTPELVAEMNKAGAEQIESGDRLTVSKHPEAQSATPKGAEEKRTDVLAALWAGRKTEVMEKDPELFNLFAFQTHELKLDYHIAGTNLLGISARLLSSASQNPFDNRYGNRLRFIMQNNGFSPDSVDCMIKAGEDGGKADFRLTGDYLSEGGVCYIRQPTPLYY